MRDLDMMTDENAAGSIKEGSGKQPNTDDASRQNTSGDGRPTLDELKAELNREYKKHDYTRAVRNTVAAILVACAIAVLVSSFFISVLRVSGDSMSPTLEPGQLVIADNRSGFEAGDLVAFYYNNKVLVKRIVGTPGDMVDIDEDGRVYVNGNELSEPYISGLVQYPEGISESDMVSFPYQVPDNRYFVLGDNRQVSIDSRSGAIGCVTNEQLIGKLIFRVYPFGSINSGAE